MKIKFVALSVASLCTFAIASATASFAVTCKSSAVTVSLRTKSNGIVPPKEQAMFKWTAVVRKNGGYGYGFWEIATNKNLSCVKSGTVKFAVLCTASAVPCLFDPQIP